MGHMGLMFRVDSFPPIQRGPIDSHTQKRTVRDQSHVYFDFDFL